MSTAALTTLQSDPVAFRKALEVDAGSGPKPFGEVMDPWQRQDFEALDPACRRIVGKQVQVQYNRAWLERPRGHSKTTDIGVVCLYLLFASRRKITGCVAAADKDQANLLRNAMDGLVRVNPWLGQFVEVQRHEIVNKHTGSTLKVMSSDAASAFGETPDFIVCDELTHWPKDELWQALYSSAPKRPHCLLLVICNAGFMDSWQFPLRESIRSLDNWYFHSLQGPQATWQKPGDLEEQEKTLPRKAYLRLWENVWSPGSGDALDYDLIEAAICLKGPQPWKQKEFGYVGGLDIGVKKDHSACCVLGCHGVTGRVALADLKSWAPPKGGQVSLEAVRDYVFDAHKRFHFAKLLYDPWQAELMAQELRRYGVPAEPVVFSGQNLNKMATALLEAFNNRNIDLYRDEKLIKDLKRLTIVEKPYGFKLESTRDTSGHADSATAMAIALPYANKRAMGGIWASHPTGHSIMRQTPIGVRFGRARCNFNPRRPR
jgi:hypothetical protein